MKTLLDFLGNLWKPVASKLKSPILAFAVLVLILGLVFALMLPAYQLWILVVTGIVLLLAISVYTFKELRHPPVEKQVGKTLPEESKSVKITPEPVKHEPISPPPVIVSIESLRAAYLDSLITDCERARLVGIDSKSADPRRKAFPLDKIYIDLDTKTQVEVKRKKKRKESDAVRGETEPLSALAALENAERGEMVLLGLPGSGKTTFVRYLALRHAQACRRAATAMTGDLPGWQGAPLLPVIIPLGRLAESLPGQIATGRVEDIEQFVCQTLKASEDEKIRLYATHLLEDLRSRAGLFLFDGIDEIADLDLRPRAVQAVEKFAARYRQTQPAHHFMVTCRTFSYTDPKWQLSGWPTHELAPLSEDKITRFVDAWHDASIQVDPARREDYEDKRKKLKAALHRGDPRRLWEIADNPLILTLMAVVHTTRGELPDARALVYEECTRQLLIQWEGDRPIMGKTQRTDLRTALEVLEITLINALQEVAYHAHERQPDDPDRRRAALVTEDLLWADLCAAFDSEDKVRIFLNYCESANGLLLWQGVAPLPDAPPDSPPRRVYAFPHLTFQEYLAARYLGRMSNPGEKARSHLDRSDRWREVVMLLGEHICFREGNYEVMDTLLQALAPIPAPQRMEDKDWRAIWMAGDLLMLYRRAFPRRDTLYAHIPNDLIRLQKISSLTPRERADAANTLARLGDHRFDKQHWFLPRQNAFALREAYADVFGFVHIPGGPFLMGSQRGDQNAYEDECDQHELILPDYYLARTPVSVAQFQAFMVDAHPPLHGHPNLETPANHPVVNVSWHDALQYCRWLTKKLIESGKRLKREKDNLSEAEKLFWQRLVHENWQVMLPSEAEWEKAARGPSQPPGIEGGIGAREYPWGDKFDPDCANTSETGLGTTSAVGCFPNGRSPYDLLDMSGNVWEWTRSLWGSDYHKPEHNYPYNPRDGRENLRADDKIARVLRGGSFIGYRRLARCASRSGLRPDFWDDYLGFRVGVVSPIFISDL